MNIKSGAEEISSKYRVKKRRIIYLLFAVSVAYGVICCFMPPGRDPLGFVLRLPLLVLGVSWCFADAAERNFKIGLVLKILLVLFWIIGFPIYLFRTRKLKAFKTLGLAFLVMLVMLACYFGAVFITLQIIDTWQLNDGTFNDVLMEPI